MRYNPYAPRGTRQAPTPAAAKPDPSAIPLARLRRILTKSRLAQVEEQWAAMTTEQRTAANEWLAGMTDEQAKDQLKGKGGRPARQAEGSAQQ